MPTVYPNPKQLLSKTGQIYTQPDSLTRDYWSVGNTTYSSISNTPDRGFYFTYSEITSWVVGEEHVAYLSPSDQLKIAYVYNGRVNNEHSVVVRLYYNGTLATSMGLSTISDFTLSRVLNMPVLTMFFEDDNIIAVYHVVNFNTSIVTSTYRITNITVEQLVSGIGLTSDPYQTAPDSEGGGGYGDFDYSGDSILPPDLPTISVADSGFVSLYAPSLTQLQDLAQYMWSGLFDISNFRKLFADPMDCIISLNILPVSLPTGQAQELKVGNIGTGQNINILSAQFIKIMFASKNIGVRTNSFMDFSPYVKAQLFLPFIGARSMSIDEIAGADITIEYHIDLFSGACTAYVTINKKNSDGSTIKSSLYQFNGNICANIPFTATNYGSFLGSLLQTGIAATTALATQGGTAALSGALSSGIDTATTIKPDVERSGNMSATTGFLGIQKPYLIITYPHVCKPACRDKTVGTPSFIGLSDSKHLSAFHGFTRLHKINVKGIPCTEQERQMIETLLTGEGVIMP